MYTAVKVFSATKAKEREELGERVSRWIEETHPEIADTKMLQSSDNEFHCLTIVLFYNKK